MAPSVVTTLADIQGSGTGSLRQAILDAVEGNYVGTNAAGTSALPNGFSGVDLYNGAASNIIGGTAADQRRFQVQAVNSGNCSMFTPDGQALVVVDRSPSVSWLAYYRVTTGTHSDGRIFRVTPDGQLLLADSGWTRDPMPAQTWLAKVPWLQGLGKSQGFQTFAIVETETGREIAGATWRPLVVLRTDGTS